MPHRVHLLLLAATAYRGPLSRLSRLVLSISSSLTTCTTRQPPPPAMAARRRGQVRVSLPKQPLIRSEVALGMLCGGGSMPVLSPSGTVVTSPLRCWCPPLLEFWSWCWHTQLPHRHQHQLVLRSTSTCSSTSTAPWAHRGTSAHAVWTAPTLKPKGLEHSRSSSPRGGTARK